MLSSIYSYLMSFYYTKPVLEPIVQPVKQIEKIEKNANDIKIDRNINDYEIDEKNVRNNNFNKKQTKIKKNKNNIRKKNKH